MRAHRRPHTLPLPPGSEFSHAAVPHDKRNHDTPNNDGLLLYCTAFIFCDISVGMYLCGRSSKIGMRRKGSFLSTDRLQILGRKESESQHTSHLFFSCLLFHPLSSLNTVETSIASKSNIYRRRPHLLFISPPRHHAQLPRRSLKK